jgi:LacI family transcriptional regulator
MRERVTAAMTELDYRPRIAARAMRGRTFTIGIEIPDFGNPFFTRILDGAMTALEGTPYQLVIAPAAHGTRMGLRAIDALVDRQVDGVIAVSPPVEPWELERIASRTPLVMFGRYDTSGGYDSVAGDDVLGTAAAMDHLFALGHTRIAHLTIPAADREQGSPHSVRLREYRAAMASAGADEIVLRADERHDGYKAMREALDRGLSATALFAAHDELAIGALRALAEASSSMSVVGYDDIAIAEHPALGLTTVHQPGAAMGSRAVELLLERVGGRAEAVHEIFAPELRVRTSTRPTP